jgi:hypothetical protein
MNEAMKAIALADDVSIIRAAEYLHETLSNALQFSGVTQTELVGIANSSQEVRDFLDVARMRAGETLNAFESVVATRQLLVAAAQDASLAGVVAHCIANWPDDRQSVGKVLAFGTLAALLLLIATTEFEYKDGPVHIHKKTSIPTEVKVSASILRMKFEVSMSRAGSIKPTTTPPRTP